MEQTQEIVFKIRKYNHFDHIVLYTETIVSGITHNILFLVPNAYDGYDFYETCSFCNQGKKKVQKINSWWQNKGFRNSVALSSDFKGSFNGKTLVFGCSIWPVLIFPISKDGHDGPKWGGFEYEILTILGKIMDFKVQVIIDMKGNRGSVLNDKALGVLGMVAYSKAVIGGGGVTFKRPSQFRRLFTFNFGHRSQNNN